MNVSELFIINYFFNQLSLVAAAFINVLIDDFPVTFLSAPAGC
jgi:hypothetical protein